MDRDEELELVFDLINAFRIVKTPSETAFLLRDLLTSKEIKNLSKRLRIAKMLLKNITEREIESNLHTSFVTISKVRSWLNQGGEGLKNVISKLPVKYSIPKDLPKIPIEFQLPKIILSYTQYAIAKKDNNLLEKFEKDVEAKRHLDRSNKKIFDEYYKEKHIS